MDNFWLQDDKPNYSFQKIHTFGVFQGFSTQDAVEWIGDSDFNLWAVIKTLGIILHRHMGIITIHSVGIPDPFCISCNIAWFLITGTILGCDYTPGFESPPDVFIFHEPTSWINSHPVSGAPRGTRVLIADPDDGTTLETRVETCCDSKLSSPDW